MKVSRCAYRAPAHPRAALAPLPPTLVRAHVARRWLALLPLVSCGAVSAQVAIDAASQQVVVSAARVEQKLPDTLPSTSVISRADIEAAPATDLPDLLRSFTSFDIVQTGPLGAQTSVFARGANSNQVLVLIDGAPLSRADFGSAPWELVPLGQVDHVEVVRGNLSSLYGASAVGGVVQIFTRRGAGASVALSAGDRGGFATSAAIGRRFGAAEAPLDLSASVSRQGTDGWSARDAKVDPGANPDRDPATQTGATFSAGKTWSAGQRTEISYSHSATHSDYDGTTTRFTPQDSLTTQLDAFALQSHHVLAPALRLDLSAGQTLQHFTDPTESDGLYGAASTTGSGRTRLLGAQLAWQFAADHSLQLQLEDRNERFGDQLDAQRTRQTWSERIGYLGRFADRVDVQANLRHDDADDYGSAATGLLALGLRLTPAWKLVGQWSSAFSAPSFSDQVYAIAPLKAERSRELELGLRWQGARWQARATLFAQRQHDLIGYDANFDTLNIDRASNKGLELAADGDTGHGKLGLDATFQNPRDDGTRSALLRRARTVASLNYRVPLRGWDSGLWLRYVGARQDVDPVSTLTVRAPARATLGLSIQHALTAGWTLGAKIENLANSRTPEVLGYTAAPRTLLFTLRGQWS